LNKEEFTEQVSKLSKMLITILPDLSKDKEAYPFIEIEQLVREKVKEVLQKHIINILTYQILNWEEYNREYVADKNDVSKADKISKFNPTTEDNIARILHYKNYLIEEEFIPQCIQDVVDQTNEENITLYDDQRSEWAATHDSDNEEYGSTPPPSPLQKLEPKPEYVFKHPVFEDPNNLQHLIDFSTDPKEGIGWLIAEYAENVFDSDETILEVITQNSEDVDPAIAGLIFGSLYFYRDYGHEDLLEFFYNVTESGYGWLVDAYLTGLYNIQKKGFEQFVQKSIERLTEHYAIVVDSLTEKFQENIDAYNKAYSEYDLIATQKAWYIFSQKQKIYIESSKKDYTSKTSIKSFETAAAKVLEKVNQEFLSIFPAELKTIYYSSEASEKAPTLDVETEFRQLATLGQTIKSKMLESSKAFASTNVVIAELVFVVSSEDYQKGKIHNKTFIKVPITFDSDTKLLSRDTADGIIISDSTYKKQIKSDHAAAKKLKLPVKAEVKDSTLEQLFFHSERVLLAALREESVVQKIVENLIKTIAKLPTYMESCEVYGAVLMLYSTNSVCDNCVYSLIANQNTIEKLHTVQSIFHEALTRNENLILSNNEFKLITLVRSDKPFSVQAKILYNENKSFGNSKAKIYLDDGSIDLRKIFELPNSNQILIESIGKDVKEDNLLEEKSLAFMSGSKKSKLANSKEKIKELEKSISSLYDEDDTNSDNNDTSENNSEGEGIFDHNSSSYWHIYTKVAMNNILLLRLEAVYLKDTIGTFVPSYVFDGSSNSALKLARDVSTKMKDDILLVSLNLYNKHWVGIVIDMRINELNLNYIDSERQAMPLLLKEKLEEVLAIAHPERQINIIEREIELQRYNNCGLEVIENFMQYLTGNRLSQEDALPIHAMLYEDLIMLSGEITIS